jgi:hypothetical protein
MVVTLGAAVYRAAMNLKNGGTTTVSAPAHSANN